MPRKMPMIVYSSCITQTPYTRKSGGRTFHRWRVLGTENDRGIHLCPLPTPLPQARISTIFIFPLPHFTGAVFD